MIAIPNMSKPKDCYDCPLYDSEYPWECELIQGDCQLIEIVPCKECIYNSNNTDGDTRGWCYKHGIDIIGFCSEGE